MDEKMYLFIFTQFMSTLAIIVTNRTDINWIKQTLSNHDGRITKLEDIKAAN